MAITIGHTHFLKPFFFMTSNPITHPTNMAIPATVLSANATSCGPNDSPPMLPGSTKKSWTPFMIRHSCNEKRMMNKTKGPCLGKFHHFLTSLICFFQAADSPICLPHSTCLGNEMAMTTATKKTMAANTLKANAHDSTMSLVSTSMSPAMTKVTPVPKTVARMGKATDTDVLPCFRLPHSALQKSPAMTSWKAPISALAAKQYHTAVPPPFGSKNHATANIDKAKSTSMATIHHACRGKAKAKGLSNCRNTNGMAGNAVPHAAQELLIPSLFSITIATDISATTTMPLAKPSSEAHSHALLCVTTLPATEECPFLIIYSCFFFPNSGSILMKAVTAKVMMQKNMTKMKKVLYPTASLIHPDTIPGSINPR